MPEKMAGLGRRLGLETVPRLDEVAALDLQGRSVHRGDVLFPRPDR